MTNYDLARGLMALQGSIAEREARREQKEFQKKYEIPYKEALTNVANAQAKLIVSQTLDEKSRQRKARLDVRGQRQELALGDFTVDELTRVKKLAETDPDMQKLLTNYVFKINQGEAFQNMIRGLTLQNQQMQVVIQKMALGLQISEADRKKQEAWLNLRASKEGEKMLRDAYGSTLDALVKEKVEKYTDKKAPPEKKGKWGIRSPIQLPWYRKESEEPLSDKVKSMVDQNRAAQQEEAQEKRFTLYHQASGQSYQAIVDPADGITKAVMMDETGNTGLVPVEQIDEAIELGYTLLHSFEE